MNDIYYTIYNFIHKDDALDRDTPRLSIIAHLISLVFLLIHIIFVGHYSLLRNIGILILIIGSFFNLIACSILLFSILLHIKDRQKIKARKKSIMTQMISIPLVVLYLIFN